MIKLNPENYKSENVLSKEELIIKLNELRKQGKKIGLCTGSFDLLHPGHITHLISAKKMCDILVVGVAIDDFSSKKQSEKRRPIFSHDLRAFMVSKIEPVDFVFLDKGDEDTPKLIKPDIYIKGKDYADLKNLNHLDQRKVLFDLGIDIGYTQDEKISTTDIIKYIKEKIKDN